MEKIAIAVLGHPMRASKVPVMQPSGAFRIIARIDAEQDSDNLIQRCAVRLCVEQSRIEHEMPPVIVGDGSACGGSIGKVVGVLFCHFFPPQARTRVIG